jgi:hypothetical protein
MVVSPNEKRYKIFSLLENKFTSKMETSNHIERPFQLVHESEENLHSSFITALEYIRNNFEDYMIVSGDALGQACIYHFEFANGKKINSTLVKKFQANDTKIKVGL